MDCPGSSLTQIWRGHDLRRGLTFKSGKEGFSPANYQGLLPVVLAARDFLLVIKVA